MSVQVHIGARVPETISQQVDRLAAATGRNRSWVVEQALRAYLDREIQFLESVERGREAYRRGDVVDHAEIEADWGRIRQHLEQGQQ